MPHKLRFGIPSLDELIGPSIDKPNDDFAYEQFGTGIMNANTSVCLMGPDGTGKSILGLHLASRYAADCQHCVTTGDSTDMPSVLYVSTDLPYSKARTIWDKFYLDLPDSRTIPHAFTPTGDYPYPRLEPRKLILQALLPPGQAVPAENDIQPRPRPIEEFLQTPDLSPKGYRQFLKHEREQIDKKDKKRRDDKCNWTLKDAGCVGFFDLATYTAGDDWAYVNRLLAILPKREGLKFPKHLLIIDAIEGLEVFAGERDAFGQLRSRRSRIAQLARTAAGKCHLMFIVEEMKIGEHLAEEFVADLVIRLRTSVEDGHARRTLEVVKSRAQAHQREPHVYAIRSGKPSLSGNVVNPDDIEVDNAYVHVYHGINTLFHSITALRADIELPDAPLPTFGIRYLNQMLGHEIEQASGKASQSLPPSRHTNITALIGDVATYKTNLAYAFLSECFVKENQVNWLPDAEPDVQPYAEHGAQPVAILLTTQLLDTATLAKRLFSHLSRNEQDRLREIAFGFTEIIHRAETNFSEVLKSYGNYLSHSDHYPASIIEEWARHNDSRDNVKTSHPVLLIYNIEAIGRLSAESPDSKVFLPAQIDHHIERIGNELAVKLLEGNIICRRLPVRDLSSSQFFHIVESAVREARAKLKKAPQSEKLRWVGDKSFHAIRLVLDDWSTISKIYPSVAADSLLLQFLIQYLQWQQVTSLIIDTQPGDPESIRRSESGRELRALTTRHIYTWHVSFFQGDRVAVAVIPPPPVVDGLPASVRELRPSYTTAKLAVDPHFERYYGLERGDPKPLPLRVLLYSGSSGALDYIREVDTLLRQHFVGVNGGPIVPEEGSTDYEALRALNYTPRGTRLDCTQVLQVDEFWKHSDDQAAPNNSKNALKSEGARFCCAYLNARTVADHSATPEDPFELFQVSEATRQFNEEHKDDPKATERRRRHSFFRLADLNYKQRDKIKPLKEADDEAINGLNTVPMMWDFGFLLCRRRSWMSAKDRTFQPLKIAFSLSDLRKPEALARRLKRPGPTDKISIQLRDLLTETSLQDLQKSRVFSATNPPSPTLQNDIVNGLNELLKDPQLYGDSGLSPELLRETTKRLGKQLMENSFSQSMQNSGRPYLVNRLLLEDAYRDELYEHRISVLNVISWLEHHSLPKSEPDSELTKRPEKDMGRLKNETLTWFDFFQACQIVAQTQLQQGMAEPVYAFDPEMSSTEGFSCLSMEIMASEMQEIIRGANLPPADLEALEHYFAVNAYRSSIEATHSLIDMLQNPICQEALMRALLLIFGATKLEQFNFPDFNQQERLAHPSAVAQRQWYSTASRAMEHWDTRDPLVPWRLPGTYSARGDWFLTIADGSQSTQLAKSALDVLSSSRANLTRLREGVGLPTRTIFSIGHQRTKLRTLSYDPHVPLKDQVRESGSAQLLSRHLRYEEIEALGAKDRPDFHWIWRSHFRHYQRHSRIWSRWLLNFTRVWHRRSLNPGQENWDAVAIYRHVVEGNFIRKEDLQSPIQEDGENEPKGYQFTHHFFYDALKRLVADLQDATPLDSQSEKRDDL